MDGRCGATEGEREAAYRRQSTGREEGLLMSQTSGVNPDLYTKRKPKRKKGK